MTSPKSGPLVFVGALAAAGVGILLWCAWLILTAPLPNGAAAAAWTLWLLSVGALVTLVAYLREMVRHGKLADRSSWKPLPGLVLLWVAGLTAMVSFPFVLPERTGGPASTETTADSSQTTGEAPEAGPTASSRTSPTSVSRSTRTSPTSTKATTTTKPAATPVKATSALPTTPSSTQAPRPTTSAPSSSSTTSPLIDITLPRGSGRPTDKPPPPGHQ